MVRKFDIYLNEPHQSGLEKKYLEDVLESNWLSTEGMHCEAFKKELALYFPDKHIQLTNSGTSALHLALLTLGVGDNDYVICPSFTFVASANPILYVGATPVFVDSEEETWNMDPVELRHAIEWCIKQGKLPKAVILVHSYGTPAKINEIQLICEEFGVSILEDAAESLGATYQGEMLGNQGDLSILSFNGNKIITTTSGGAIISNSEKVIRKSQLLANQSRDEEDATNHVGLGFNYRMSNLCAGIGVAQISTLQDRVKQKQLVYQYYYDALKQYKGIRFQEEPINGTSSRWLSAIVLEGKEQTRKIISNLLREKIECRNLWKPVHYFPQFKNSHFFGENYCHYLHEYGLVLPSGLGLNHLQLERIINLVIDGLK